MSFNGSGVYNLPSPEYPAVSGTDILASDFNEIVEDIQTALSLTFLRDGQASMQANLKMGGFKVTGAADGTADTDLVTVGQLATAIAGIAPASSVPVGAIIAWCGGYFSNTANGSITSVLGNSVAAANAYLNDSGWYVCDGSVLNDAGSAIFNGGGRYLPNLTDSRFIMGSTACGTVGGGSTHTHTHSHTHSVDIASFTSDSTTLTLSQIPAHTHTVAAQGLVGSTSDALRWGISSAAAPASFTTSSAGSSGGHTHAVNPPATTSADASNTTTASADNRPIFLSSFFIMKVK